MATHRHHAGAIDRSDPPSGDEKYDEKDVNPSHLERSSQDPTDPNWNGIDPVKERKLVRKIDLYVVP